MKTTKWLYANVESQRCGAMECSKCGEKIIGGDYRYKELNHKFKFEGYVNHEHRSCSVNDPEWAKLDARQKEWAAQDIAKLKAFQDFAEKWQTDALNEQIYSMERSIRDQTK